MIWDSGWKRRIKEYYLFVNHSSTPGVMDTKFVFYGNILCGNRDINQNAARIIRERSSKRISLTNWVLYSWLFLLLFMTWFVCVAKLTDTQ